MQKRILIVPVILFLVLATGHTKEEAGTFKDYWYQNKAELTRFSLQQSRYGEIRKGEAVLIFVTEPFLKGKQVKYEHGDRSGAVSVLKLNFTRRFFTGIYPYTLITSTFSPVDFRKDPTLKVTSSTQEWCGVTYTQLNRQNDEYHALLHSYFQDEGDQDIRVRPEWLEDEIWTRIRIAPETLPDGNVQMLPGLQALRFMHQPIKPQKATASLNSSGKNNVYTIDYPDLKRRVVIEFEKQFPFAITQWEETAPGGFSLDSPPLTTKAVKTNTLMLDYWDHHGEKDSFYRQKLGLTQQ
jgi:hypothetical protein